MANRPFYFPAIDGLRFLAFLLVFFHHSGRIIGSFFFIKTGWAGVELFFLLSGFLLTKLLLYEYKQANSIQLYKYFIRRILRIWPLYFLYLLLIIFVSLFLTKYPLSVPRLIGTIFFYDNILTAGQGFNNNFATGHLWSISLEEQYYLLLPFLIPLLAKQSAKKMKLLIIISFILLFILRYLIARKGLGYPYLYVLPFSCDSFLAGIILGLGTYDVWIKKINSTLAFVIGAGLFTLLYFLPPRTAIGPNLVIIYFVPAAAFFFIFISVVYADGGLFNRVFTNKPIRYLGKISFGLYVFHQLVNIIIRYYFYEKNELLGIGGFILILIITILLAILSYELIEKHFLRMKDRFTVIKNREI